MKLVGLRKQSNGLYVYRRRVPKALLQYIDKKELWIEIGNTLEGYDAIHETIEAARLIASMTALSEDLKQQIVSDLLRTLI